MLDPLRVDADGERWGSLALRVEREGLDALVHARVRLIDLVSGRGSVLAGDPEELCYTAASLPAGGYRLEIGLPTHDWILKEDVWIEEGLATDLGSFSLPSLGRLILGEEPRSTPDLSKSAELHAEIWKSHADVSSRVFSTAEAPLRQLVLPPGRFELALRRQRETERLSVDLRAGEDLLGRIGAQGKRPSVAWQTRPSLDAYADPESCANCHTGD